MTAVSIQYSQLYQSRSLLLSPLISTNFQLLKPSQTQTLLTSIQPQEYSTMMPRSTQLPIYSCGHLQLQQLTLFA
ncbi:hypothetical protein FGO68_gene1049 [Halteria grandinella]|uniref:Uncharacterized protein n=1 Tax=Halteria grandinella TaxID=5974 RepID=A0A8J8T5W6_HALGN|nr:hypothetical protein FGO68_gene1049 [Halteria grandinella]